MKQTIAKIIMIPIMSFMYIGMQVFGYMKDDEITLKELIKEFWEEDLENL